MELEDTTALDTELEEMLTCGICLELFNNGGRMPKFLNCHHSLCLMCLKDLKTKNVLCPTCRRKTKMKPSQTVDELFTNFYILPIVEKRWSATLEADQPIIKKLTNIREMVMVHTRDLEKLMDCDSTGSNDETIKSLKTRYKKLFTIQKDSTSLQNQLEDKDLQLEDSDKARKVALKKLVEWEAELKNSKQEINTLSHDVSTKLKI